MSRDDGIRIGDGGDRQAYAKPDGKSPHSDGKPDGGDSAQIPPPPPGHFSVPERGGIIYSSQSLAESAVRTLLRLVGEDPDRQGLRDTPARVVRAWREMCSGYEQDPMAILGTVFDEPYDEIVICRDIPFCSNCEHHLLPFIGTVDVGYIPGKVVGLSKLARLVDCFSRRLQIQEKLTRQIADAINQCLAPKGVAVVVRAEHSCMACRGVKKAGACMVTSAMLGSFRDKPEARAEFLALCERGR